MARREDCGDGARAREHVFLLPGNQARLGGQPGRPPAPRPAPACAERPAGRRPRRPHARGPRALPCGTHGPTRRSPGTHRPHIGHCTARSVCKPQPEAPNRTPAPCPSPASPLPPAPQPRSHSVGSMGRRERAASACGERRGSAVPVRCGAGRCPAVGV